jgi:hypothetical protein
VFAFWAPSLRSPSFWGGRPQRLAGLPILGCGWWLLVLWGGVSAALSRSSSSERPDQNAGYQGCSHGDYKPADRCSVGRKPPYAPASGRGDVELLEREREQAVLGALTAAACRAAGRLVVVEVRPASARPRC